MARSRVLLVFPLARLVFASRGRCDAATFIPSPGPHPACAFWDSGPHGPVPPSPQTYYKLKSRIPNLGSSSQCLPEYFCPHCNLGQQHHEKRADLQLEDEDYDQLYRGPASTLHRLTLTCQLLNAIATPHLYHYPLPDRWWLLVRTLIARPDLGQAVWHLFDARIAVQPPYEPPRSAASS